MTQHQLSRRVSCSCRKDADDPVQSAGVFLTCIQRNSIFRGVPYARLREKVLKEAQA
jgi:hypothetical protein